MNLNDVAIIPNLKKPKVRYYLSGFIGLLFVFCYAPFSQGWLAPLLLASWLLLLVRSQNVKQALLTGFSFGLGWFGAGISWVYVSIDQFGGLPLFVSVLLVLALVAYLALYPALAAFVWFKARRYLNRYALLAFPLIWLFTELLRGWVLTGFPWLQLGYTQLSTQYINLAPHLGEVGITLFIWLSAIGFSYAALNKSLEWFILPVGLYGVALLSVSVNPLTLTGETTKIALVQGNIEQELKWNQAQEIPNFLTYQKLSAPFLASSDMIIWPESAITFIEPMASQVLAEYEQSLLQNQTTLISGIVDYQPKTEAFYNSIIVIGDPDAPYTWQNSNRYQKNKLLPIGEFIPFENTLRPLAPLFNLPMSSFSRGAAQQTNLTAANHTIAANICYEIVYSHYIRKQQTPETQFILTLSNDTWFGASHGPHQHLEIARMRAIELGKPLIRATNNGISALIDHQGHSILTLPQFEAIAAEADVAHVEGTTYFTRFGAIPTWILALIFASLSFIRRNRSKM